jgi:CDGSH-type Zn-finger protein
MSERKQPFVVEEEAGSKAICACAGSQNQPYCDGTHRDLGKSPLIVEIEKAKTVAWCGCRRSANFPYCDGTHNTL